MQLIYTLLDFFFPQFSEILFDTISVVFLVSLGVINKNENLWWENNPLFCLSDCLHSIRLTRTHTHSFTFHAIIPSFLPAVYGVCSACDRDLYIIVCSAYSVRACLYVLRSTRFIIDHEITWEKRRCPNTYGWEFCLCVGQRCTHALSAQITCIASSYLFRGEHYSVNTLRWYKLLIGLSRCTAQPLLKTYFDGAGVE